MRHRPPPKMSCQRIRSLPPTLNAHTGCVASVWPRRRSSLPDLITIPLPRILSEYRAAAASRLCASVIRAHSPRGPERPPATPPPQRTASPPLGAETLSALQRSRASPPLPPCRRCRRAAAAAVPPLPPHCGSSGYDAPILVSPRPRCRARTGQRDAASPVGGRAI